MRALGIGHNDKVLTVSLTSPFTSVAIIEEGAIPVYCDIDQETLTLAPNEIEKKIDKNTKAIIPVHIFGNPCDMEKIKRLAKKNRLHVIEDACQAHGAGYQNQKIGSIGDVGAFSFYPTKNLGCMGDGGMVVTNNRKLAEMIRFLRHGGQTKRFWHEYRGVNSRLDEIQAAILGLRLKYLTANNRKRKNLAQRYKKLLSDLPIKFQKENQFGQSANHLFVIRTRKRGQLQNYLLRNGVASDIYYPYPVHKQKAFKDYASYELPVTEKVTREILALPLYPSLTIENQNEVILLVKKFFSTFK